MSTFFGVCLPVNGSYEQRVSNTVHISSVSLEGRKSAKIYVTVAKKKHLVATLDKKARQMCLDLIFSKGDHFMFEIVGRGRVSILGYQLPETNTESQDDKVKSDDSDQKLENNTVRETLPLYSPGYMYPRSESPMDQNDDTLENRESEDEDEDSKSDDNGSNSEDETL